MTRAEYIDTIDITHQCCICEEPVDPRRVISLSGPTDDLDLLNLMEFKKGPLLVCPRCYRREIADAIQVDRPRRR